MKILIKLLNEGSLGDARARRWENILSKNLKKARQYGDHATGNAHGRLIMNSARKQELKHFFGSRNADTTKRFEFMRKNIQMHNKAKLNKKGTNK